MCPQIRCLHAMVFVAAFAAGIARGADDPHSEGAPRVTDVPVELRAKHELDPFYVKHADYQGYPILSSAKVSDAALLEARHLIGQMLAGRDDIV
ncbi:MAG TPA: hypothetical protein VFV87_02020, partial [Pirellulaceae bacterium]|nr:hypothetical protein [Pirellulaceae bacterium]